MSVLFIAGFCTRWMAPGAAKAVEMPTLKSAAIVKHFMVRSSPNLILPEEDHPLWLATALDPEGTPVTAGIHASRLQSEPRPGYPPGRERSHRNGFLN